MKWILRVLILLFLMGLLLAIFAPSILSTQLGKKAFIRILRSITGYEIDVETLQLQWLKGQEVANLKVLDTTGHPVFQADSVTSTAPLWKLLFYHDVGHLQISHPTLVLEPPAPLTSKLMVRQAGFISSIGVTPSIHLLGEISVTQGEVQFNAPGLDPISLKEILLEATLLPQQIKIQTSGAGDGTFQIDLLAFPGTDQIDATAKVEHFPLRAADQLISILYPDLKGAIRDVIGESFNADLKLKNIKESLEVYFNAKSDFFSASLETKVQDDTLELASPAVFQFQIPAPSFQKLTSLPIQNNIQAQLKIDQLSIPLQNRQQLALQGTLKSEALQFEEWTLEPFTLFVGSGATLGDWNVKIDSPQVQFQGALTLPEKWENLSFTGEALLPKNTKLDVSAQSLNSIAIAIQGDVWKGQFKGALDPQKKNLTLKEPGTLSVQLENLPYSLPSLPVQATLDPCVIRLSPLSGILKGTAEVPSFQMETARVGTTSLPFTANIQSKEVQFSLTSSVNEGPLNAEGSLKLDPTSNALQDLKVKGACSRLPLASLQPILPKGPPLVTLLGDQLTTNFQLMHSQNSNLLQLKATTPLLKLSAVLKGNEKRMDLLEPASFVWTLTPQGYTALSNWLQGSSHFQLSQATKLKGTLNTLSFSFDELLNSLEYQGKVTSDELSFEQNGQTTKVSNIQMNFNRPIATAPHQFQISASAAPKGTLTCQGSWTPPGTADIKLQLDQFPSAAFDVFTSPFVGNKFQLTTLCGPTLNLSLSTTVNQWTGPLTFELHSANLRTALKGTLTQGVLTLNDKFHLQLNITKELSEMFFKQLDPNDTSSLRSEGPITLEIAPQGFSYPLVPSTLDKLQIGKGRLELGKILCQNDGNLQTTLGLLKLGQYRPKDELELWFAPLDFQIQNGSMKCERTEILIAKDFQVCLWGDVDFPRDSIDAILGLTASCLKNAFGIKNLPENYVLQIPVRGTLSDVKIDKGKATTKIGALLLWQQKDAVGGIVKGPAGKFLGESLSKIGPLPGGDQKAPPAKKPFPWDKEEQPKKKKNSDTSHEHKKLIRPDDSALKQVLKLIR